MEGLVGPVLLAIISATSIFLGIVIFAGNKKSKINQLFALIALFILLWNVFGYLGYWSKDPLASTLFFKINFAAVALYFGAFYYFTIYFPVESPKRAIYIDRLVLTTCSVFGLLSLFTNLVIKKVNINGDKILLENGLVGNVFYLFTFILTGYILYSLFKKNRTQTKDNKAKTKFFLVGTILYAVFNVVFNIVASIIFENYKYTQIGDFSAIFFLGFTAYAITKHQLFNIKVIATETTVIALSIILFVQIFLSKNISEGSLKSIIWILATYGGYVLIKSIKKEIKQKEDLEEISAELQDANDHLKELDETKDNFLSMAAHELNTPISAIEGYLSMIVDEKMCGPLDEKTNKYLTNVYQSSKRLAALVKDLLNTSRIESNRIHLIYEEAQIEDVIDQAIAEVKIKADEAGHKLVWNRPKANLPKTFLDKSRIIEIIINLLGNAVKYTEKGGKIEVEAHTDGGKIVVAVKDNGRGIPKDKSDHIFEKFVQVDVLKDEVKGTGLGMFISKNLIELHKGKIWFKSSIDTDDHGTTFYFSLPVLKEKPADKFEGQGAVIQSK